MNTLHSLVKSVLVVEIIFATSVHSSQNKNNMNNIFSDDMSYCGALIERNACLDNSLSDINSINNYLSKYSDLKVDIFVHCAGINELAGINANTI